MRNFYKHKYPSIYSAWLGLLLLSLLLVACGEANPTAPTNGTPVGLAAAPVLQLTDCQKQAAANPLPITPSTTNESQIAVPAGFKSFLSEIYPYRLAYPTGWDLQKNQSRNDVKGDFFVATNKDNQRVFVTVTGRKLPAGVNDVAGFYKTVEKDFVGQAVNPTRETDRRVAGTEAYVFGFNTDQPGFQVQTIQLIFVGQNQAWNVSYNASYNESLSYCADFGRLLDSFTFVAAK